jgi:hypothetical protein
MPTNVFEEVRRLFESAAKAGYGGEDVYAVAEALSIKEDKFHADRSQDCKTPSA